MRGKIENHFGCSLEEALELQMRDSITVGFCTNGDCDGTNDRLEPDAANCHCDECGENTVTSIIELAIEGLI